jgi:hypothetical protein
MLCRGLKIIARNTSAIPIEACKNPIEKHNFCKSCLADRTQQEFMLSLLRPNWRELLEAQQNRPKPIQNPLRKEKAYSSFQPKEEFEEIEPIGKKTPLKKSRKAEAAPVKQWDPFS